MHSRPIQSDGWLAPVDTVGAMEANGDRASEYTVPRWDSTARAKLTKQFFASPYGAPLNDPDRRRLFQSLLRYAISWSSGAPLHWTPEKVRGLLCPWIASNLVDDAGFLAMAPALLRAFVRFADEQEGVRAYKTRRTLEAIEQNEPLFQNQIRSDRSRGRYLLRDDWSGSGSSRVDKLSAAVGGLTQLRALDAEPLPDSLFDWSDIPDEVCGVVEEILVLTDRCCDKMFDTEYRTACRRLLARAAAGDPSFFQSTRGIDKSAAAVVWCICEANGSLRHTTGLELRAERRVFVKDVLAHFGTSSSGVSECAAGLLRAADPNDGQCREPQGSADFLIATTRRQLIALRERYLDDLSS